MKKKLTKMIHIQNASKIRIPPHRLFKDATAIVLNANLISLKKQSAELCIRIVDKTESASLNKQYRKKKGPTNVLAFPLDINNLGLLGDLVICNEIVRQEAFNQGKTLAAHFSHMVIHGTLHLLGFDHQTNEQALEMESLEIKFLKKLGFSNPYTSMRS